MDEKGGRLDLVVTLEDGSVGGAEHERGGGDLRPVPARGLIRKRSPRDQAVGPGDGEREMVAHTLLEAEPGRPAQGTGEIPPLLLDVHGRGSACGKVRRVAFCRLARDCASARKSSWPTGGRGPGRSPDRRQPTPSAALARAVSAWKKAGGWPLNRLEAVRAVAAACAPAEPVDDGRITEQVGSCSLRKVQRLGKTCDEPCRAFGEVGHDELGRRSGTR